MNWIKEGTTLKGKTVELIPLEEKHFKELESLAKDKRIWEFTTADLSDPEICLNTFSTALKEKENGTQFPFVILHKKENKLIGSTRFLDIQPNHRKLEIGWTWLHPGYWATIVNIECKLLLLTYCFEELNALRVQFKTDENNLRSQKAIAKIGGLFEGILRNDIIRQNGTQRNSVYFSIIDDEWKRVKNNLWKLSESKK